MPFVIFTQKGIKIEWNLSQFEIFMQCHIMLEKHLHF